MSDVTVHEKPVSKMHCGKLSRKIKAGIDLEKTKRIIQERLGMGAIENIDLQEMHAWPTKGRSRSAAG